MDPDIIILSEVSQMKKKKDTNEHYTKQKQTHGHRNQTMVTKGERGER